MISVEIFEKAGAPFLTGTLLTLMEFAASFPLAVFVRSGSRWPLGNIQNHQFNTLATWREELTHLKRSWCWERLRAGGEGDDRGWDGWMASPVQWTWVWVNSGTWWWTGRPGVLQFMGSQRVRHDWATELNWTELLQMWIECVTVIISHTTSRTFLVVFITTSIPLICKFSVSQYFTNVSIPRTSTDNKIYARQRKEVNSSSITV